MLVVRGNMNVSNTQPLNERVRWNPTLTFLQGMISLRPGTHLKSTKDATNHITQVCELKYCSGQLICIDKESAPNFVCFRRLASLFKFKCCKFIPGGSVGEVRYSKSPPELRTTHMRRELFTNLCGRSIHFRSLVATSQDKPIKVHLER